jgi:hypothetical protein
LLVILHKRRKIRYSSTLKSIHNEATRDMHVRTN